MDMDLHHFDPSPPKKEVYIKVTTSFIRKSHLDQTISHKIFNNTHISVC